MIWLFSVSLLWLHLSQVIVIGLIRAHPVLGLMLALVHWVDD
jgi:hypothetical protein